jgi:hypothetical protein
MIHRLYDLLNLVSGQLVAPVMTYRQLKQLDVIAFQATGKQASTYGCSAAYACDNTRMLGVFVYGPGEARWDHSQ